MRPLTFDVLRLLSEREFRSGQALARSLNISRASVWTALNEAQAAGLHVQRIHGRGYRLVQALDWLDADHINARLRGTGIVVRIEQSCESTNSTLLTLAEAGAPSGIVVAAELQTRGRGRLGRAWHSGVAGALTFSMLWRFSKGVSGLAGLSLAVGVAIARALTRLGIEVGLKWPNDLLWQGRKLGGILIEVRGDALGPCAAVIGVGLNVRLGAAERERIDQPIADLFEAGAEGLKRNDLLAKILAELAPALAEFGEHGFARSREEWIRRSVHRDKPIRLRLPDGAEALGVSRGVDDQGRLLVDSGARVQAYLSAEVSMRVADDTGD